MNTLHISVEDRNAPVPKRIVGAVLLGLLEFLFVLSIFTISFIISMSFFPSFEERTFGSLFVYGIIMATVCAACLLGISVFARKLCEKYPQAVGKLEAAICLKEKGDVR